MIPEAAQGSARLLEALEKLAEWAGSGPGGNGPSGPPSEDVVRAFEEALAGPSEGAEAEAAEMVDAGNASVPPDAAGMADAPYAPGPAESVPPLEGDIRVSEAGLPASEMNGSVSSPAGAEAVDSGPDRRPGAVQPPEEPGRSRGVFRRGKPRAGTGPPAG